MRRLMLGPLGRALRSALDDGALLSDSLPIALVLYAVAPDLAALGASRSFFVGALYLGALSSFTTIAQQRAPSRLPRPGARR